MWVWLGSGNPAATVYKYHVDHLLYFLPPTLHISSTSAYPSLPAAHMYRSSYLARNIISTAHKVELLKYEQAIGNLQKILEINLSAED
jgi:hypothetical protein